MDRMGWPTRLSEGQARSQVRVQRSRRQAALPEYQSYSRADKARVPIREIAYFQGLKRNERPQRVARENKGSFSGALEPRAHYIGCVATKFLYDQ